MKSFTAPILKSATCCPRAIVTEENRSLQVRKCFALHGVGNKNANGSRTLSISTGGYKKRGGIAEDRDVLSRMRLTGPAAVSLEEAEEENCTEDNEDGDDYLENSTEKIEERRLVSGERVLQISKADFTVSSLLDKIRRGRLDLRPSYQRDYVWDKRTASKLIESVLLNIPLPTMFFHERSQGQLEVVDGKQRLTSIWCFMEDQRFPDGSEFALTGLEVLYKLNGLKYLELDASLREVMQDFALNVHTISRHSDAEVVFEVFERLNMGSTQLNEQELRNCVFQGRYNDLLEELAVHRDMLRVFRQESPHKRMRDREFILRFFALRRSGIENFYLPVKNWLNNEMRRNQFLDEGDFMVMKFDFQRCLSISVNVFGEQLFRLPRGQKYDSDPNVCLWDTIMDTEFKTNLLSTPKSLKIRTRKWLHILREVLGPS